MAAWTSDIVMLILDVPAANGDNCSGFGGTSLNFTCVSSRAQSAKASVIQAWKVASLSAVIENKWLESLTGVGRGETVQVRQLIT